MSTTVIIDKDFIDNIEDDTIKYYINHFVNYVISNNSIMLEFGYKQDEDEENPIRLLIKEYNYIKPNVEKIKTQFDQEIKKHNEKNKKGLFGFLKKKTIPDDKINKIRNNIINVYKNINNDINELQNKIFTYYKQKKLSTYSSYEIFFEKFDKSNTNKYNYLKELVKNIYPLIQEINSKIILLYDEINSLDDEINKMKENEGSSINENPNSNEEPISEKESPEEPQTGGKRRRQRKTRKQRRRRHQKSRKSRH